MANKRAFDKVISLRVSKRLYESLRLNAEAHNRVYELRDKSSLQAYIRYALNFSMDHPNFSERVRKRLALISTKLEKRGGCPINPSDILYEALADLEKKYKL